MAISFMADDGQNITSAQDGAMYNVFAGGQDFVIGGIGNELAVQYNSSSLQVTLGTGEGIICGRHFNVTGTDTTLTLSANSTGTLVVRYDLTQSGSNVVRFRTVSSTKSQNINDNGSTHDLVLGTYSTSASGVSNFTDARVIYSTVPVAYATSAGSATTATTATKLGSSTVGGTKKPIYLNSGTPTALSTTVGAANQITYLSSGTITAGITIRSGTDAPDNSVGSDGDIYIRYSE